MIKFFRKIRQRLVAENKFTQYLIYALGEIILVMVGILLVLQVSNWNQNRLARNKEKVLLTELNLEFKQNKTQLEDVLKFHRRAKKSADLIIAEFPINVDSLDLDSFRLKDRGFGFRHTFNPSQGIINSLVNTSSFDLISNPELRKLLVSWRDVLQDYQEEEDVAAQILINHIDPYLIHHLPGRRLIDKRVDLTALETLEYETWIRVRRGNLVDILGREGQDSELKRIQYAIDRIIELSEPKREEKGK